MFYPNTVWNSGNLVLDSAAQKTRKFVVARGYGVKSLNITIFGSRKGISSQK
jgi:hypothetical protein